MSHNFASDPSTRPPAVLGIDVDGFNPRSYPRYTIGRVLEFGDERAYAWLKEIFSEREIKDVILASGV